ncbi:MAG: hypothetical protein JXL67_08475 [Calditrichaeota bacterium]|nr:hypothetical protein [Calditrichota bacterium]
MKDSIFIWRSEMYDFLSFPVTCPWCGSPMRSKDFSFYHDTNTDRLHECLLCGWYYKKYIRYSESFGRFSGIYRYATLKEFSKGETPFSLDYIESYLTNHRPSHRQWSPSKIDGYIGGILGDEGIDIVFRLRASDHHGMILIVQKSGKFYFLELFKKNNSSSIGIRFVNCLIGIHLNWSWKKACLLTEVHPLFESDIMKINFKKLKKTGYKMDLEMAAKVMTELGIYDTRFPPLHKLTESQRTEIIETNKKTEIERPMIQQY